MITLQALIDVCSPPNFAVMDLNYGIGTCILPFLIVSNSKFILQFDLFLTSILMFLIGNNICACWTLGRPILALENDSKIFDKVLKPLLDANLGKTIVCPIFNLDDDFSHKKKTRINLDCE